MKGVRTIDVFIIAMLFSISSDLPHHYPIFKHVDAWLSIAMFGYMAYRIKKGMK